MFYKFGTVGSFQLQRDDGRVTAKFLKAMLDDLSDPNSGIPGNKNNLQDAIRVYLFATEDQGAGLCPWYVGKTDAGFGKRLNQHWKLYSRLAETSPKGNLFLFLFPRVTPQDRYRKKGKKPLESLGRLEDMLIGSCLTRNPNLINDKKIRFHQQLSVPGYYNDQAAATKSAKALRRMLKLAK